MLGGFSIFTLSCILVMLPFWGFLCCCPLSAPEPYVPVRVAELHGGWLGGVLGDLRVLGGVLNFHPLLCFSNRGGKPAIGQVLRGSLP